ncbi:phosphotransferase family protein [Arthrobacter castelli]|uniref:phosphotransferase family protein n=1 Tax=Arthrobacter castelli TaxID=271431 RepID=UPI0003F96E8A|nr:aminoglycoside phosphotransferase family protein [Arthrobacter castelli]
MVNASGVRISWTDVPDHVQAGVERILDGTVVQAVSQSGGFSPGTADRVQLQDGRRYFIKAVHPGLNSISPSLHRRELAVAARVPANAPVPRLVDGFDDGDWVALVFEDIEGRHPHTPWQRGDVMATLQMLDELADTTVPTGPGLAWTAEDLKGEFSGWQRLTDDPWPGLDPLAAEHLPELVDLAQRGLPALAGDSLVHSDLRADNLLIRPDGRVVLVDWPFASKGCDWFDMLTLLINVELYGGHDVEQLLAATPRLARVPDDRVNAVLAGLCGYFYDAARSPPPPRLPTVRQFQLDQGDVVLGWLGRRMGWAPQSTM